MVQFFESVESESLWELYCGAVNSSKFHKTKIRIFFLIFSLTTIGIQRDHLILSPGHAMIQRQENTAKWPIPPYNYSIVDPTPSPIRIC